jgi:hypothetical protein
VLAIVEDEIVSVTSTAAALLDPKIEHGHAQINGSRASAGPQLAERLAAALYQDARSLKHRSLG